MRRLRFSLVSFLSLAVAVLGGLVLVVVTVGTAHAFSVSPIDASTTPGGIEGVLYEPDGITPVTYGWIDIHDAEDQPWMGTDTDENGFFSIANLPPGEYVLEAHPPPDLPYGSSLPVVVEVLSGQWVGQDLQLTEVRISGWVQDSETGARIEGAAVVAHDDDWIVERWSGTNTNGEYKIGGVDVGVTYTLEAFPPEGSGYVQLPIRYTAVPIATDVVLEMHIPPTSVVGIVHNPDGNPVPDAGVVVFHDEFWAETAADELGGFLFRDLPPDEFWIQAAPPWGKHGRGLLSSPPFTIVVSPPPTVTNVGAITLPRALKSATGKVVEIGTDDRVTDAVVHAHRLDKPGFADTPVDAMGLFTLSLPGGEWHLGAEPLPHSPTEWIFHEPPAWIAFTQPITTPEEIADVLLEVIPTNARVEGHVVCPRLGGCLAVPGLQHGDIWVELRNEDIAHGTELGIGYRFDIPIPDGWYELVVHVEHRLWQGPEPIEVFVGPGQTLDVGDIELWKKDAYVVGQVRTQQGSIVPDVRVVAWQPDAFGWGWAETDANGAYTMPVIPGEWFVEPHPDPDMPYVFRQRPQVVQVAPGGTMAGVDFTLTYAGARIQGMAVGADDPAGERIWGLGGWASAHVLPSEEFFSDAPVWDGGFELKVRGGYTYAVGVDLPPHAPYVSGDAGPVPVAPGELVTTVVLLKRKDAAIEGQLVISGTSDPALGVWAEVFGEDEEGHWTAVRVNAENARYWTGVVSGTWHLRAWVDPAGGYVAAPTPMTVTAESGQPPAQLLFEVVPIGSYIEGQVLQPNGSPMTMTVVFAEGESPFVGYFETYTETDENGYFHLPVPEGEYLVGAGLPHSELKSRGWLNPPPIEGVIPPATGLELRFSQLNAEIQGTVSFAAGINITLTHPAYVWGWAESGEWMEVEANVVEGTGTFTYSMPVVSGTVWHIGTVYDDWNNGQYYESAEKQVDLTTTDHVTQDLTLSGPYAMPQPIIVSFDGSQMQTIVMPDGVELSIPPGAIVVSGTVTLFIFPTQEMRPEPGQEIIGPGYEMWAVDQDGQEIIQFNQNVIMTFYYPPDAVLEAQGVSEYKLVPVYYSTLVGHWILADSYVVDTVNNEITLQIDHFSKFGMFSTESEQHRVYLPVVLRNFQ